MNMPDLTIRNADLWNALAAPPGVDPPLVAIGRLDVPITTANALRKALRKAREAIADVEASREALVAKYAPEGADPDTASFAREFAALLAEPVTLADVRAIPLSALGAATVPAVVLDALVGAFLTDDLG